MNKILFVVALFAVVFSGIEAMKRLDPQRPDCLQLACDNRSKELLCVRSKKDNCQLLTICEVSRVNCQRGPQNALIKVNRRRCVGMKHGQKLQRCNPEV